MATGKVLPGRACDVWHGYAVRPTPQTPIGARKICNAYYRRGEIKSTKELPSAPGCRELDLIYHDAS